MGGICPPAENVAWADLGEEITVQVKSRRAS
jgi:hypothetical protein